MSEIMTRGTKYEDEVKFWGYHDSNQRKPCGVSDDVVREFVVALIEKQRGDLLSLRMVRNGLLRIGISPNPEPLRELLRELGLLRLNDCPSNRETYRVPKKVEEGGESE